MKLFLVSCVFLCFLACQFSYGDSEAEDAPTARADSVALSAEYDHNFFRKMHGVPELRHDRGLQSYAEDCAELLLAKTKLEHTGGPYGENHYEQRDSSTNRVKIVTKAIYNWYYYEQPYYNYKRPGYTSLADNFTQLIWKDTKEFGVGMTYGRDKLGHAKWVVCITYNPPGNVDGMFKKNVLPEERPIYLKKSLFD